MNVTCTLSDGKQQYEWIFNPSVVTTSINNNIQEHQSLSGDNQYIYFLGRMETITLPLSIPGVHSNLNPTLTLLRKWVNNHAKLKLSYGSILYSAVYLKSITETIVQFRDGQPVSAEVSLEFAIEKLQNKTPVSINTEVKTDREKAKG